MKLTREELANVRMLCKEFSFNRREFDLYCWFIGYLFVLQNFNGEEKPPTDEKINAFIKRQ